MRWRTVRRMAATAVVGLLVPGAVAADGLSLPERLTPVYLHHLHDQPGFAFDGAEPPTPPASALQAVAMLRRRNGYP